MKALPILVGAAFGIAAITTHGQDLEFRTDINPALLYFQAFQLMPEFKEKETETLHETEWDWRDRHLTDEFHTLVGRYDQSFKLLNRARHAEPACEWGYDLSDGPWAYLPGLAPAKRMSQLARLRAMSFLDKGEEQAAVRDLTAGYFLARNLAEDRVLISTLVQIAIERIITSTVAENYYRFSEDALNELVTGFESAPARGTMADCVETERQSFAQYWIRKLDALEKRHPDDDQKVWWEFATRWRESQSTGSSSDGMESVKKLAAVTRHDPDAIRELLEALAPFYDRAEALMRAPFADYMTGMEEFSEDVKASTNPLVVEFLTVFERIRQKEFSAQVREAMVKAAAAYKTGGKEKLDEVKDPLTGAPFQFSRVSFEGEDRGFKLESAANYYEYPEVMIFLETPGKPFRLDGKNAGTGK